MLSDVKPPVKTEPADSKANVIKIEESTSSGVQPRPLVVGHGGIPGKEEEYDSSATVSLNIKLNVKAVQCFLTSHTS